MDKTKIECGADFFAKEIERVNLKCKGNVVVKDAIMHSQVNAEGKVIVEEGKGWIVGGAIHAGDVVDAKIIGSRLGINTELEVPEFCRHVMVETAGYSDPAAADSLSDTEFSQEGTHYTKTGNEGQFRTTRGRIKFKERMYPGVRIKIGPHQFVIENELISATLYCTHEGELRMIHMK